LFRSKELGGCTAAAAPGNSGHESGTAIDLNTSDVDVWKETLEKNNWKWYGDGDTWHFSYMGKDAVDLTGASVLAFQKLWNLNNPKDKIPETSKYDAATSERLKKSPAAGFKSVPSCG
jgi:hypothetical protein